MKIKEAINNVRALSGNAVDDNTMCRWLSELDGRLMLDFYKGSEWMSYVLPQDEGHDLLVPFPWDELYVHYLEAMVYYSNGEFDRYRNSYEMFNKKEMDYRQWYARNQLPITAEAIARRDCTVVTDGRGSKPFWYLSAYALAVKHGFQGTELEWLESLVGPVGPAGPGDFKSDGTVSMTGNLQMGGNKLTGLEDGTAATDGVTKGQMDNALSERADLTLSNLSNYQKALRNIGGRPNRNLLDNAYFVGGGSQQGGGQFPINQRGETSYSNTGTTSIDRWICHYGATVTINSTGVVISGTPTTSPEIFMQKLSLSFLPQLAGQVVTLSAIINGQLGSSTFTMPEDLSTWIDSPDVFIDGLYFDIYDAPSGNNCRARFFTASTSQFTLTAAKLELGPVQTLAYQDEDGNWQLFEMPDFQEELAKCQRYALYGPLSGYPLVVANGNSYVRIPTPVPMRSVPVFSGQADVFNQSTNEYIGQYTLAVTELFQNAVTCYIAGITVPCYVNIGPGSGLSADL